MADVEFEDFRLNLDKLSNNFGSKFYSIVTDVALEEEPSLYNLNKCLSDNDSDIKIAIEKVEHLNKQNALNIIHNLNSTDKEEFENDSTEYDSYSPDSAKPKIIQLDDVYKHFLTELVLDKCRSNDVSGTSSSSSTHEINEIKIEEVDDTNTQNLSEELELRQSSSSSNQSEEELNTCDVDRPQVNNLNLCLPNENEPDASNQTFPNQISDLTPTIRKRRKLPDIPKQHRKDEADANHKNQDVSNGTKLSTLYSNLNENLQLLSTQSQIEISEILPVIFNNYIDFNANKPQAPTQGLYKICHTAEDDEKSDPIVDLDKEKQLFTELETEPIFEEVLKPVTQCDFEQSESLFSELEEIEEIGTIKEDLHKSDRNLESSFIAIDQHPLEPTHRGLYKFIPRHSDEILVDIGDLLYVEKEDEDLWNLGINLRTNKKGVFPSACVCDIEYADFDSEFIGVKKERYVLGYLGSMETVKHKGVSIICEAVKKIMEINKKKNCVKNPNFKDNITYGTSTQDESFNHARPCILEISDKGLRMTDKSKHAHKKNEPCLDYFYSLKNVSFCAFHPRDHRYLGFITKHPTLQIFACHLFVGKESTREVAESVGRAFQRFYQKFIETAYPIEDIYIE